MNLYGYELTQAQSDAGTARMRAGPFKAADVKAVLIEAGVPEMVCPEGKNPQYRHNLEHCAMRAADRLIQSARKQQLISFDGKGWIPTPADRLLSAPVAKRPRSRM